MHPLLTRQAPSWLCLLAAALVLAPCAVHGKSVEWTEHGYVDQSQTGRVTSYKLPATGGWQSFTAGWTGNLTRVDLFLGAALRGSGECVDYDGTVSVYAGRGLTDVQELDGGSHLMHQQALIGSEGGTGSASPDHDCLRWQQVVLTTPQAVVTGQEYTVRISPPSRPDAVVRLGLLVADGYARGMNNFVAPGYDYTFKTVLREPPPDVELAEQTSASPADSPRTLTQIVVPVLVAGAVAIALVVLVVALARRNRRTAHLEQEWYTLTEATSEWRQRFNAALATALRNEGAGAAAAVKEPELLPPPPTHNRLFVFSEADSCEKATSGDTEHIELAEMDEDGMMMGQPNVLGGRQDDGESNL